MAPPDTGPLLANLVDTARRAPRRMALIQGLGEISYEEMVARISGAADALRQAGIKPGDRILLCAPNTPAIPILYFAIHASGAIAVVAAPDMPADSLRSLADAAEARLALLERSDVDLACPVLSAAEAAKAMGSGELRTPAMDAPADLLFTSGTTGKKKGVLLTHANAAAAARNISDFLDIRPEDIQAVPLPLSHSFGLGCIRSMALSGHTLLIERGLVNPAAMLKRMSTRGATGLAIVPTGVDVIRRMTGDALGGLRDSLRFVELGSAPISSETRAWLMDTLPRTRLCHHYGMTEASRTAFIEYHADAHRPGSVGRASSCATITILDDDGSSASIGETGEIAVAGDMVMSKYWNDPDLTRTKIGPYGLMTGDVGHLDADGYLYLLGRRDDVINVGGRKVSPDEVEEALRRHPAIIDACCVAMDDPVLGQAVSAHVVRAEAVDNETLLAWLRPQLEDYKLPRAIVTVDRVPRTEAGKVQRHLLRGA